MYVIKLIFHKLKAGLAKGFEILRRYVNYYDSNKLSLSSLAIEIDDMILN